MKPSHHEQYRPTAGPRKPTRHAGPPRSLTTHTQQSRYSLSIVQNGPSSIRPGGAYPPQTPRWHWGKETDSPHFCRACPARPARPGRTRTNHPAAWHLSVITESFGLYTIRSIRDHVVERPVLAQGDAELFGVGGGAGAL